MAKNKKDIKISNPSFDKLQRANTRKTNFEKRFKMPKHVKTKIKALLAAATIVISGFEAIQTVHAANESKNEKMCVIALPNDGAEIEADGKSYKIDENSFVIISDNQALAYDENGTIHKGYIDNNDFTEVKEISEEKMQNYSICQVTGASEVNVRSSGEIEDDNIISTVLSQDYVLAYTSNMSETDGQWISTLSINDNTMYDGYIYGDYLEIVQEFNTHEIPENPMLVNTDYLNIRYEPDEFTSRNILAQIPNGTIVSSLGETTISGDREWIKVEYKFPDGQTIQGWVASEYLTPYVEKTTESSIKTHQLNNSTSNDIKTNAAGSVTGIDFSEISPDDLKELLQNGIPSQVSAMNGNVNTSQVAGDINFAYIKLGASPYGKNNDFKPLYYDNYEEQVKVCEELGIPYGFYYYSTATTVKEANIELEYIKQTIQNLKQKYNLKHYKLEIAVDVELSGTNDRQYQGDIERQTEAKAFLINGIQELDLSENVLVYGPIRVMQPDSDRIIDLSYLHSLLSNPDDVALWLCSPTNTNGEMSSSLEKDISYAEQQGFDVVAYQVVLDGKVIGQIDINTMDLEHFEKLLERENKVSLQMPSQSTTYDDER